MRVSKNGTPYERDEQKAYFDYVNVKRQTDWRYANIFSIPNGAHLARGAKTLFSLKRTGLRNGVPDIFLAIPSFYVKAGALGGLFIEMKRQGNDLRPEQAEWKKRLIQAHFGYALCFSATSAIDITDLWMEQSLIPR